MGYELYYEGRITFDRPVSLARPEEESRLPDLRFFNPVFERAEGTSTSRHVTGFQVDEETGDWAKSWPWQRDFAAIEDFARRHQVTLTAHLRWQGDGCPSDPADDRGQIVFDLHGTHHQVPDSKNDNRAVEAHRQRCCTCYGDPAPHPAPAPSPAPSRTTTRTTRPPHPTDGPVQDWFGLSYSNYQVLHRTLMQSMPLDWQTRMVSCLEELGAAFRHIEQPHAFHVQAATEHIVNEMTPAELATAGIEDDWYAGQTPPAHLTDDELAQWQAEHEQVAPCYYQDGRELDPHERVLLPAHDPIPHYNRGRTYIEPSSDS
ncbi:hypothetical protein [Streptomyces sp. NPDC005538]|uniref:hypothetical protein n=1 Tax=Streptomyces sp. NPDC005538 TaxID=3157043 RepID=UPI0033A0215D